MVADFAPSWNEEYEEGVWTRGTITKTLGGGGRNNRGSVLTFKQTQRFVFSDQASILAVCLVVSLLFIELLKKKKNGRENVGCGIIILVRSGSDGCEVGIVYCLRKVNDVWNIPIRVGIRGVVCGVLWDTGRVGRGMGSGNVKGQETNKQWDMWGGRGGTNQSERTDRQTDWKGRWGSY